ncbi:hypothetical protein [Flavivirga spongiicola]|uniref:SGNH/GDSL hydrolase family protein n=1 Tax=Flavivirga spongiicola TaxID=421621 RepID=A0ABU7XXH8_9FLAO|nr:hypothetical protein [Flavivirga sp. MEBiC05379]MDO5980467.1 hypothetical protein [Flavivirga sp. MEBiC05379]
MKKLFIKCILYLFLILIALEVFVRVFHLYTEVPIRYIDEFGVEKSLPNQTGYAVTGNRRQNHSEYKINNFGFNSYRDFTPSKDKIEIAIIGDSFIEGMHQDYYDSTGKKIENKLKNIEVYEYGYAGYDLADQLNLVNIYKEHFKLVDHIIIYLKYDEDLERVEYKPNNERIALLKSPLFRMRDKIKLLSYASSIGIVDPIKNMAISIINRGVKPKAVDTTYKIDEDLKRLENFKALIDTFGFDKSKMSFLLNSKATNKDFLDYCKANGFQIIDYGILFEESEQTPTLIYDQHWNDHGRELISKEIAKYFSQSKTIN